MKTKLATSAFQKALGVMPAKGQCALKFDMVHNLVRIVGIPLDGEGFVYTDIPAKIEYEEGDSEHLDGDMYTPMFGRHKLLALVDTLKAADSNILNVTWDTADNKLVLRWKNDVGRNRQSTFNAEESSFPPIPEFDYANAIELPDDIRKVFQTHNALCKNADEPKYRGFRFTYSGEQDGDQAAVAYVRSTDKIRMLQTAVDIGLPDKEGEHHFDIAFPEAALKQLNGIQIEHIRLDYQNAVFQVSTSYPGNPIVLVRVLTKTDLPEFNIERTMSRTMFDEEGPPDPSASTVKVNTSHFAVKADELQRSFRIAGLLTDESRLVYITPLAEHVIDEWTGFLRVDSLESQLGVSHSHTELYPIDSQGGKIEGNPLRCGLSCALVKTVFGLMDDDHYVHIHANPKTPCVFIWGEHSFIVMPMVKRENADA